MDALGLPVSFGKKAAPKRNNVQRKVEQTRREDVPVKEKETETRKRPREEEAGGPTAEEPSSASTEAKGSHDEDDDDDDNGDDGRMDEMDEMPVSHEIVLKDHSKAITALSLDPSGARLVTGSHDYDLKIWDFGGMDASMKPFKTVEEPCGSYPVVSVEWRPDGQAVLVVGGGMQARVFGRDGEDGVAFNKGDPYIRDMRHTKGHVADLTAGTWNPTDSSEFLTSSNDSTLRLWDASNRVAHKSVIVVKSRERGARTKVTTCAYASDGKTVGGGCEDGTVHFWDTRGNLARPVRSCETAHEKGVGAVSGMAFSRDRTHLVTRGGDDTVKLWDMRSLRKPLFTVDALPNAYPQTNIIFSPDDKSILTGLSVTKGEGKKGEIIVLNREGLTEKRRIAISDGSVIRVAWHSRINQILASTSLGTCHVLYSPTASIHGALLPLSKMPRQNPARNDVFTDPNLPPVIMTPHALPMFKDEDYRQTKRQKDKARSDPVKSRKPEEPMRGAGKGGRVGASATQHLVQHMFRNTMRDEDPREALLKYADTEADPIYTKAWKENQPNPVFDNAGSGSEKKDESKESS